MFSNKLSSQCNLPGHLAIALGMMTMLAGQARSLAQAPAKGQAKPAAAKAEPKSGVTQVGNTVIESPTVDVDLEKNLYVFGPQVKLVQAGTTMTAKKMTVQFTPGKELEWARCEGQVSITKKGEDGVDMDATADTLLYKAKEEKAELVGEVVLHQTSPKLKKPAEVTGSRVDMDLKSRQNIVHGGKAQARVHLEPIGKEGEPDPEIVDLTADRIDMNGVSQQYIATGSPLIKRPTSTMRAKQLRFQVEDETKDVKLAYADDDVVYDGKNQKGGTVHVTGDKGVYNRDLAELVVTGNARAKTRQPNEEQPTELECDTFTYNMKTGKASMKSEGGRQSIVRLPQNKLKPEEKKENDAASDARKGGEKKQ
jgi:lipopolysaccharide transport protein LptA